jgi:hypothetical protein
MKADQQILLARKHTPAFFIDFNMMKIKILKSNLIITLLFVLMSSYVYANSEQTKIGEVVFARGAVSAQSPSGTVRVLGKEVPIYKGDIITSGAKSFSVIKMIDESRLSIRPDTVMSFKDFSYDEGNDSAVMKLFKGGIRSISGLIGKNDPEKFKLETSVATIGIRGTDFDARMCEVDCTIDQQDAKKKNKKSATKVDKSIAKIAFLKGDVYSVNAENSETKLKTGSSLFEGDMIETKEKSFAVIIFKDKGRITLKEETKFKIEKHNYEADKPEENSAVFRLIKGGMRAITGYIGKKNKKAYKVKTPTATIGIRGTGYDLVWLGACTGGGGCGLSGSVWSGAIFAKNEAGEFELLENQSFQIRLIDATVLFIDTPPVFNVPRPDEVNIDFDALFSQQENDVPSGLYVNTREGQVFMKRDDGQVIEMIPGQGGFVSMDGSVIVKLEQPKAFQTGDPYMETINEEFDAIYNILGGGFDSGSGFQSDGFGCLVQ